MCVCARVCVRVCVCARIYTHTHFYMGGWAIGLPSVCDSRTGGGREREIQPQYPTIFPLALWMARPHVAACCSIAIEVMTPSPAQRAARPCKSLQVQPGWLPIIDNQPCSWDSNGSWCENIGQSTINGGFSGKTIKWICGRLCWFPSRTSILGGLGESKKGTSKSKIRGWPTNIVWLGVSDMELNVIITMFQAYLGRLV